MDHCEQTFKIIFYLFMDLLWHCQKELTKHSESGSTYINMI